MGIGFYVWLTGLASLLAGAVTVPAGTFTAFKVEGAGNQRQISGNSPGPAFHQITFNDWIAPEKLRSYIALEFILKSPGVGGYTILADRNELASYFQQIDVGQSLAAAPDRIQSSEDVQKAP